MPLARVRVALTRTGLPTRDQVYWQWAVDGASISEAGGLALVQATVNGLNGVVANASPATRSALRADLIEVFPGGPGEAFYVQGIAPGITVGTGSTGFEVIQCAVNEMVESPRGPAPRGRMFVGPLSLTAQPLLTAAVRTSCVRVMQEMHAAFVASDFTPVVISRTLNNAPRPAPVGFPIIGYAADLRLDLLKSRRVDDPVEPVVFPPVFTP